MKRVKIANLKNNLSMHLTHVRRGGDVIVFDRDTPVARIVPFGRGPEAPEHDEPGGFWTTERLATMERRGVLTLGDSRGLAEWADGGRQVKLPKGTPSVAGLLVRTRRESAR